MSTYRCLITAGALSAAVSGIAAAEPRLGQEVSDAEIAAWDIDIPPSGAGLPMGSGSVTEGAAVYAESCLRCHGEDGTGGPADPLTGGLGSLTSAAPMKTVGSYWPYATTLFDYTRRAMPFDAPMSLSDDAVYAVTAYLLHLNGIVGADAVMDADTLPAVEMPNRQGFVSWYPPPPHRHARPAR